MKLNNIILSKIIKLTLTASYFANQKKSNTIKEKELFIALIYLINQSIQIKKSLSKYGFNVDKIANNIQGFYSFPKNIKFDIGSFNISFSEEAYSLLEKLNAIQNDYLIPYYLLLNLLSSKPIIDFLNKIWLLEVIDTFDMKWFLDEIYINKNLQQQMENIFIANPNQETDILKIFIISKNNDEFSDFDIDIDLEDKEETIPLNGTEEEQTKLALDTFGTDLTKLAEKWKLEPVVWREKETKEIIYTLLRKTKNNPLLVGEAGVGKTAIIEGLAQKIAKGEVPEKLKNKKIYMLDMGTLIAGTKYRGEFEARIKQIIEESIDPENNVILFIDEIHTIIGAGNVEWWADTANLIKPHLARGELTLIWATTFNEYQKYIEKDPALTRRFQLIKIEEPSENETIRLLEWIKYRFEDFHGVNISTEAVKKAVKLSKRYILERHLPDKAIDLIDEAAARKSTSIISKEKQSKIKKIEDKIKKIENKITKAIDNQDYFTAIELKEKVKQLKNKIYDLKSANDIPKNLRPTLIAEDIEKVIAEKYWISSKILSKSEISFLSGLEDLLNQEIIWQEEAVKEVVSALIRNKLSPIEKTKPIGAFLFLGPSGVWKTYLAELLAKYFFQDEKALIKINMSEYTESISSSKLIWASAGYVGYEEGGLLTEAVRKKPYSVVLFDEVEKGSSQVLNILLQILDQWYLEDNKWRKVDFKNTIIILTSNLGSEYFNKEITKVGFDIYDNKNQKISNEKKELIMNEVKGLLPIELLNRLDKIVFFNPVDTKILEKVFEKYYKEYRRLWQIKKWIRVPNLKKEEIKKVINKIHKEGSGVRWIEKYIYNELENKVIEKILSWNQKKSKRSKK